MEAGAPVSPPESSSFGQPFRLSTAAEWAIAKDLLAVVCAGGSRCPPAPAMKLSE